MPIIPGVDFPGSSIAPTESVTADRNLFLAAAAGRTLFGYAATLPVSGGNARGRIIKGAVASSNTGLIDAFELTSNQSLRHNFPDGGIDVADGVSLDWVAGPTGFNITLYYKDLA